MLENDISYDIVNIAGVKALYTKSRRGSGGETYNLIHNGYGIQISKLTLKTSRQEDFENILSSFRFIR